jgi:hypothetical protein
MEGRKQAISLRLSTGDIRRIKRLAQRLDVRDSDVVRFALKTMFQRLGPLIEPNAKGRALVPVFVESGAEIVRHFDLDSAQLGAIINEGADHHEQVETDDIQLMAMVGAQKAYARLNLRRLKEGGSAAASTGDDSVGESLRRLLYKKYGYSENGEIATGVTSVSPPQRRATDPGRRSEAAAATSGNSGDNGGGGASGPGHAHSPLHAPATTNRRSE